MILECYRGSCGLFAWMCNAIGLAFWCHLHCDCLISVWLSQKISLISWKLKSDIKSASQHASQDTIFTMECSNCRLSFVNKGNPLHPLLWEFFFLSLSLICLQCTLFLPVVSLFLTRASLAPLERLQSDLSVKSDPFRLRSTDLLNAKVLLMLAKWPPHVLQPTTAARSRSPNMPAVTWDSVDTNSEDCCSRRLQTFPANEISDLFELCLDQCK